MHLEGADLRCHGEAEAIMASVAIRDSAWMYPYHLQVSVIYRENAYQLDIDHFQGDHWNDEESQKVWLRIAPLLVKGACIHFRNENESHWRIRWHSGRVYKDHLYRDRNDLAWAHGDEITPKKEDP